MAHLASNLTYQFPSAYIYPMTEFATYLTGKKIDPEKFEKGDPSTFAEYQSQFAEMHPASFTSQKLFMINKLRRSYPITNENGEVEAPIQRSSPRPAMARPKPRA
jgi:hypothetical protein